MRSSACYGESVKGRSQGIVKWIEFYCAFSVRNFARYIANLFCLNWVSFSHTICVVFSPLFTNQICNYSLPAIGTNNGDVDMFIDDLEREIVRYFNALSYTIHRRLHITCNAITTDKGASAIMSI